MQIDMKKVEWITKSYSKTASGHGPDVHISEHSYKRANKEKRTVIKFRNGCYARISTNLHICLAVVGTRLYMREAEPTKGFKLTGFNKDNSTCHTQILSKVLPVTDKEQGGYVLEYDKSCGLYYIDILHKVGD